MKKEGPKKSCTMRDSLLASQMKHQMKNKSPLINREKLDKLQARNSVKQKEKMFELANKIATQNLYATLDPSDIDSTLEFKLPAHNSKRELAF